MNGTPISRLVVLVAIGSLAFGSGCASEDESVLEPRAATESAINRCGAYAEKPSCNAEAVVRYVWEHKRSAVEGAVACGGCATALVGAGAVVTGTGGAAVVSAALVLKTVGGVLSCMDCVDFSKESGIAQALGCGIDRVLSSECAYSADAHQTECTRECQGLGQYGYLSGALCKCTPNRLVATCGKECPPWTHLTSSCSCVE